MKRIFILVFLVGLIGCNSDSAWDCIKTEGSITQESLVLPGFTKIETGKGVQLIVEQGVEQKVILETGENLRSDVKVYVKDSVLHAEETFSCNYVRDYAVTKIFVTSPNITQIRNGSAFTVESSGVLSYPNLSLLSEDSDIQGDIYTNGDFKLQLDVENLSIVSNNISNFYITGTAEKAFVGFYSGSGRFEGKNLIVQELRIYQRSTNKMFVNPQQSIKGEIRGIGDVISYYQPALVEVEEYYTGELIFQ